MMGDQWREQLPETGDQDPVLAGERLRTARQRAGLSTSYVASQLRLSVGVVEAIEAGELAELGAPVYVRGYLANYASLLGLQPELVISAVTQAEGPDIASSPLPPQGSRFRAERVARWATLVVVVGLMGLTVAWWHQEITAPQLEEMASTTSAEQAVPEAQASETATPEAAESLDGDTGADRQARPATASVGASLTPLGRVGAQRAAEKSVVGLDKDGPAPTASPALPAAGERVSLSLVLSEDSWVQIEDASGERLEYDLVRAGSNPSYRGQPPFDVLLGNAGAVEVELDGTPFDTSELVDGNDKVARFKVGQTSVNAD